jgi:hypothetical protein
LGEGVERQSCSWVFEERGREQLPVFSTDERRERSSFWLIFFYSMKSYSSFSFVKSYCSILTI